MLTLSQFRQRSEDLVDAYRCLVERCEELEQENAALKRGMTSCSWLTEDVSDYIIDCRVVPFTPESLVYREEKQIPTLIRDTIRISKDPVVAKEQINQMLDCYQHPSQTKRNTPTGYRVKEDLVNQSPYSVHLGDFLMDHPDLVPDRMKQGMTYFWSIYVYGTQLCVRFFEWNGRRLTTDAYGLDHDLDDVEFVAVRPKTAVA